MKDFDKSLNPTLISKRIPEIDGLRGIAIIGVLIAHFYPAFSHIINGSSYLLISLLNFNLLNYGGMGVYLFFVISGYLIGGILIHNKESDNYFKVFYIRRTFRIFPIYYLLLIIYFLLILIKNNGFIDVPEWILGFEFSSKWYFTYTQNFKMAMIDKSGTSALAATWSLAVEEQFYLLLPIIVRLIRLKSLKIVCYFSIIFAVVFRLAVWFLFENKIAANWLLPGCLDSLMIGVLIAIWMRNNAITEFFKRKRKSLKILLFATVIFSIFLNPLILYLINSTQVSVQIISPLSFNLTFAILIILGLTSATNSNLSKILCNPMLKKIGVRSYFIYLTHTIIYIFYQWQFGVEQSLLSGTSLLIIIGLSLLTIFILAEISWRYFEKPLINYGHHFKYKS